MSTEEEQPIVTIDTDEETPIDEQVLKNGLHCIGKTFNNARHAFLSLSIPDSNLNSIKGLDKFKYLQNVDVSGNNLVSLKLLGSIKHLIKLNASNNKLRFTFDFLPPANLEWVDYSGNQIMSIQNAHANKYLKYLYLDNNNISRIDGLDTNKNLRVLSLNGNQIQRIENLPNLWIEELFISANQLSQIEGLETLPVLRTLDLSKNQISKLKGLETIQSLKFLNLNLNNIKKVNQLKFIENLPLLTEVDFCVNPLQCCKNYRLQCLFHMPQLRMLDGVEISSEEKVKAENLHGYDLQDREIIFKSLLPEEKFIDRRIGCIEDVPPESDEDMLIEGSAGPVSPKDMTVISSSQQSLTAANNMAKQYVGELISRVDFNAKNNSPRFVQANN